MLSVYVLFFFFKQKTAYEMRISDWSSDVCSSDLRPLPRGPRAAPGNFMQGAGDAVASYRFVWSHPTDGSVLHGMIVAVDRHARGLRGPGAEIGRASCRERVCQYV